MAPRRQGAASGPLLEALVLPTSTSSSGRIHQHHQLGNLFLDGSIDELDMMRLHLDDDDEVANTTSCWNNSGLGGLQLLEPDSWTTTTTTTSDCGNLQQQQILTPGANVNNSVVAQGRRKKRRNRQTKSSNAVDVTIPTTNNHHHNHHQLISLGSNNGGIGSNGINMSAGSIRMRAGSLSSASTGSSSSSPPATSLSINEFRCRRQQQQQQQQLPFILAASNNANHQQQQIQIVNGTQIGNSQNHHQQHGTTTTTTTVQSVGSAAQAAAAAAAASALRKKQNKMEFFGDRVRQSCGANGIFSRRLDFSAFNSLPRNKLNSYHIKMEDEGNHGNDDTRCFILSTLAGLHRTRVTCVLCRSAMPVFDRYPLIDGTFFLSPRQHSPSCAEVKIEGRTQYLSAVCMVCLEGSGGSGGGLPVRCRSCTQPWDGSSLVLGTMYSYDIFAAMPCCTERLKCNSCQKLLIYPHQRLNFYSDYSRSFACPHCRTVDAHFVKPLDSGFTREHFQLYSPWP